MSKTAAAAAKLMLLDTYGLVYAAFFAMKDRPLTTSRGVRIEAAYVFTTTLTKLVADEKPTHVVACFDAGLPAARVATFAAYKAQRESMPDELRDQFALVRRVLDVYGIPMLEVQGEEADDVIATLASQAEREGAASVVVTGDNDLLQVVDERTTVLVRTRMGGVMRYDPAAVFARFELEPRQLADYRGLKGDPSDNLPGIPGVGEKTAVKLIKNAGSLDALLANPDLAGSPKLAGLVREHGDIARRCRDVSLIRRDLEIAIPWDEARYAAPAADKLYVLYRDLEFKSLLAKLPPASNDAMLFPVDGADFITGAYRSFVPAGESVPDLAALAALLTQARDAELVALAARGEDELGISLALESGFAFRAEALADPAVRAAFGALIDGRRTLIVHDWKGLQTLVRARGLAPAAAAALGDDTMIAAHLLNPSRSYVNADDAVSEYLAKRLPADASAYADAALRLAPVLADRLAHREQTSLYRDVELPLADVLARMEARGIAIDRAALDGLSRDVDAAVVRLQDEIFALAGERFNIGSPQQLGAVLFERLALPNGGRTKTGWATGIEVLQPLAREHEIVAKVLEYREVTKLKNTYIDVIPKLAGPDGRLRTVFNQTTTATGRLSSTNPNLQNVPVRTELGRLIRRAFVAPPGRVLLAADYSQIELRIMAHLSGDEAMRAAFSRGDDIHDVTARGIFAVAADDVVTNNQRRIAKSVNFGLLYGMSDFGLAARLEIERAEARAMTEAYFGRFPSVRAWIEANLEFGREHGYVETLLGRRRYMPDLRTRNYSLRSAAEREATNAPMQGSAADLMKLAMVRIERLLSREAPQTSMLLQIHDELIFETGAAEAQSVAAMVKGEMESAVALAVPLEVTLKLGQTWYDVQSLDLSLPPELVEGGVPD
jgi:DNA polymerase-1